MKKAVLLLSISFLLNGLRIAAQESNLVVPIGHFNLISDFNFSPDGNYLVTASFDQTAKVWDVRNGKLKFTLRGHSGKLTSAIYSPDGKKILTTAFDTQPIIWDSETGLPIRKLEKQFFFTGYTDAQFNNDGTKILTPHSTLPANIWDVNTGKDIADLGRNLNTITVNMYYGIWTARYSHDNKYIFTSLKSDSAEVWNADTYLKVNTLREHKDIITDIQVSTNDNFALTRSKDSTSILWEFPSCTPIQRFGVRQGRIIEAKFSPDNKYVAMSTDRYKLIILYDIEKKGTYKQIINEGGPVTELIFNPSGSQFATKDSSNFLTLWDTQRGVLISREKYPTEILGFKFSPDGKEIAVSTETKVTILKTFDFSELQTLSSRMFPANLLSASPNGNFFVTTAQSSDNTIRIWDLYRGRLAKELFGHTAPITRAVYGTDNYKLISTDRARTLKIWNTRDGTCKKTIVFNTDIADMQSSRSGHLIAVGLQDGRIQVFDESLMTVLKEIKTVAGLNHLKFSPDERLLSYTSSGGKYAVINLQTAKIILRDSIAPSRFNNQEAISFDRSGKYAMFTFGELMRNYDINQLKRKTEESLSYSPPIAGVSLTPENESWLALDDNDNLILKRGRSSPRESYSFNPGFEGGGLETYMRNVKVAEPVKYSSDGKFLCTLNNNLQIISSDSLKLIYRAKAEDFILPDSGNVVLYSNEGVINAYSLKQRKLIFSIMSMNTHDDGFLTVIPSGHYMGNKLCAQEINYLENNTLMDFAQKDILFNRPDKVLAYLNTFFPGQNEMNLIRGYANAFNKRTEKLGITAKSFDTTYRTPVCDVSVIKIRKGGISPDTAILKIKATSYSASIKSLHVLVNYYPVYGKNGIVLTEGKYRRVDTTISIVLLGGNNLVQPYVVDDNGSQSSRVDMSINREEQTFQIYDKYSDSLSMGPMNFTIYVKPKLVFIGIGIDHFKNSAYDLKWSTSDIRGLAKELKLKDSSVVIDTLFNENVTAQKILDIKERLKKYDENDKVIIAYSGHGLFDRNFNYYLSTYAIDFQAPEKQGLNFDGLESLVDGIKPRSKLMLIDACHSGEIDKTSLEGKNKLVDSLQMKGMKRIKLAQMTDEALGVDNSFELMRDQFANLENNTGTIIISASGGAQSAVESDYLKHGALTSSLLEYMQNHDHVTTSNLKRYALKRVPELTKNLQIPTVRYDVSLLNWRLW